MTKGIKEPGGYKVGRGKPPTDHQWEKGRSGNPRGRPKKVCGQVVDPQDPQLGDLILAEGWRSIPVTEGGKQAAMPAARAVFQALLVQAIKGNSYAQARYLQLIANAQAQREKAKQEELAAAVPFKMALEEKRRQWVAYGRDEIEMDLHPSDIEFDPETGKVRSYLAFTEEARAERAKAVAFRDHLLRVKARSLRVAAEDGDDMLLQLSREVAERDIEFLNENLPPRFRRSSHIGLTDGPLDGWAEELWRGLMRQLVRELFSRRRPVREAAEDSG